MTSAPLQNWNLRVPSKEQEPIDRAINTSVSPAPTSCCDPPAI
ncbi:MAG: hypothetical protein ACK5RA_11705 [Cyanobacteriota bacterium]